MYAMDELAAAEDESDDEILVIQSEEVLVAGLMLASGVYDPSHERKELKAAEERAHYESMSEKNAAKELKRLEKLMLDHARNLEFEKAAQVRDQLTLFKEQVFGAAGSDNVVPFVADKAA